MPRPSVLAGNGARTFERCDLIGVNCCLYLMHFDASWYSWLRLGESLWPQERFHLQAYLSIGLWEFWRPVLLHFSLHILLMVCGGGF